MLLPDALTRPVRSKLTRKTYDLTAEETAEFRRLRDFPGVGLAFWRRVAATRGLDPETVITVGREPLKFTALPVGHGKWWCWPSALECRHKPQEAA